MEVPVKEPQAENFKKKFDWCAFTALLLAKGPQDRHSLDHSFCAMGKVTWRFMFDVA